MKSDVVQMREEEWLVWLHTKDPFSWGYLSCEAEHHVIKLAHAIRAHWSSMAPDIQHDDRLFGRMGPGGVGGFTFGSGVTCTPERADELKREEPIWGHHLDSLVVFWNEKGPGSRLSLPADEKDLGDQHVYWAGWGGHAILGFEELLEGGTEEIRETILRYGRDEEDPKKQAFREALLVVCDGIDAFAANYAEEAERRGNREFAERCSRVPRHGARTFPEALQSFWFIHLLDGADSPGRLDQFLWSYYEKDLHADRITPAEAQDWMDHLWKRFNDTRSWNVCAEELLTDGTDGTNDLTYMALEATRRTQSIAPNLSLRLHRDTPEKLWKEAIEVIATGVGMPALYNDEVLVPALMRYGIAEEDAKNYAMNGCSQVDIQGCSHMGLEDGELNLLKCLELALYDGTDPVTGKEIGVKTGDPRCFTEFEELWEAYVTQVEAMTRRLTDAANAVQRAHGETSPNLLRSLFVKNCIESGMDFKAGGPLYNHGQILTQGIANTADSLSVMKMLVFEKNMISMDQLLNAMSDDFFDEALRQMLINGAPKFGNDDEFVDALAVRIIEHFYQHLNGYETWRGGVFAGGSVVFTRAVSFGKNTGATPDGRKAGTPLADSVGPSQGRDTRGPTAMFNSVSKVPQILAQSAYVLNVKFHPQVFMENRDEIIHLFRTYFDRGGQQIQVNVIDGELLREAKVHPEEHQAVIVRVGGFSEYFAKLSSALQDDVIARTESTLPS